MKEHTIEKLVKTSSQDAAVTKRHFYTFDTFRFYAFLKVFLQHIPIITFAWFNLVRAGGAIGVQFFFVLSGFLITYIILNEKKQAGSYSLRNFFVRRVLRIWPLFYLIVGISYVIPAIINMLHLSKIASGYQPVWWVSVLFLENYKMIFTHSLPGVPELAVTWSLCIEEHFYILWGLLLWRTPVKIFPKIIASCIIIAIISRLIFFHYDLDPSDVFTNIDLFAFGAIPAYLLVFYNELTEAWIKRLPRFIPSLYFVFVVIYVLIAAQVKNIIACNLWLTTLSGIIFSGLIFLSMYNKAPGQRSIVNKAGTYTYGLYMYHVLIIVLLVRIYEHWHLSLEKPLIAALFTITALALTYLCSKASYRIFEKPFLKLKRFFR